MRGYNQLSWKERGAYDDEYYALKEELLAEPVRRRELTEDAYVEWERAREELQARWFERAPSFDEEEARTKFPWAVRYWLDKV